MVYSFVQIYEEYFFIARLSNAEWAALSVSNVIWPVVNTAGIKTIALHLW